MSHEDIETHEPEDLPEETPYAPHPGVIVPDGPMPEVPPGPVLPGVSDDQALHGKEEGLDG